MYTDLPKLLKLRDLLSRQRQPVKAFS